MQFHETDEGVAGSPPRYAEAAGASTTPTEQRRPTNFMSLDRVYGPIKDTWIIDTNLHIPEALLPPLGIFASLPTRPNLALHTAYGSIKGSIFLVSPSSDRAVIRADTAYGNVALQVRILGVTEFCIRLNFIQQVSHISGSSQPFKLSANTKYGNIVIRLPRDYIGPLKYKTGGGSATFSAELRPIVVEISSNNGFVGDLNQNGFVDYKAWSRDEIEVETSYGDICFMYADEVPADDPPLGETVGRAVKTALGWIGIR
jgi:hypothetical protein